MARKRVLAMVMAGGKGERLYPLTRDRSKPAVPFGGKYRLIDFVLSNLVNSEIGSIYVLTQYKSQSLAKHLQTGWHVSTFKGTDFIMAVPPQMRLGDIWYRGTADAIYQNLNLIEDFAPDIVAVFGADHVYRMDVRQMLDFHVERGAEATISAIPVPIESASMFGVIRCAPGGRVTGFDEKPAQPAPFPDRPGTALASMGNYLFDTDLLVELLNTDAAQETDHDFGKDILPKICDRRSVFAYDFASNDVPGRVKGEEIGYWRDVGTIRAYFEANMDLRRPDPVFNLYNRAWPLRTAHFDDAPAKFVFDSDDRRGLAVDSLISEGCIISGGRVANSILGRNVFIHSWAEVDECILMDRVNIGRKCRIRRAIIDKNVHVPPGTVIGYDPAEDRRRFHVDEESGIVVIPKAGEPRVD
jgi:glucose-1-phosphate adenylyltransferase